MKIDKITPGAIVKVQNPENRDQKGYYKVTSVRGGKANLGSIFGRSIYHKGIPVVQLTECHDEWYTAWSKTESYQCM